MSRPVGRHGATLNFITSVAGVVLAASLAAFACLALVFVFADDNTDPAVERLGSAVQALRQNPAKGASSLPEGVSTYYEPAATGARELRGALYMTAAGGRCAVADVTVSAGWFTNPESGSFAVEDPRLVNSCPGG